MLNSQSKDCDGTHYDCNRAQEWQRLNICPRATPRQKDKSEKREQHGKPSARGFAKKAEYLQGKVVPGFLGVSDVPAASSQAQLAVNLITALIL